MPALDDRQERTCLLVTSEAGLARGLDRSGVEGVLAGLEEACHRGAGRHLATTVYVPDGKSLAAGLPPLASPLAAASLTHAIREIELARLGGKPFTYVILVGDGDVVPFWRVENPAADSDADFPTDAPYGVVEPGDSVESLLLPDRAVARIPLLAGLARLFATDGTAGPAGADSAQARGLPLGLSTAIWQEQARRVYRLATDRPLLTSPPVDLDSFKPDWLAGGSLLYFNVHGSKDERYWYGQQDLTFPRVLSPELVAGARPRGALVVTEACYGGLIDGRKPRESIALQFLAGGAAALVASSAIAYGSPTEGLSEADLLVYLFLKRVMAGERSGDALVEAKTDFASEMLRRQGYLDGDDKKTLVEFNLFGDPCARLAWPGRGKGANLMIPEDVMESIKRLVAGRFPEMEGVEPDLAEERAALDGSLARKVRERRPQSTAKGADAFAARRVFVASFARQVVAGNREVERIVRITFDERGEVLKIVTSK